MPHTVKEMTIIDIDLMHSQLNKAEACLGDDDYAGCASGMQRMENILQRTIADLTVEMEKRDS